MIVNPVTITTTPTIARNSTIIAKYKSVSSLLSSPLLARIARTSSSFRCGLLRRILRERCLSVGHDRDTTTTASHRFTAIIHVNPRQPAPPFKNLKILLVQSFTARTSLLTPSSAFRLGKRRWSSYQQCYLGLHCLREPSKIAELIQMPFELFVRWVWVRHPQGPPPPGSSSFWAYDPILEGFPLIPQSLPPTARHLTILGRSTRWHSCEDCKVIE